MYHHILQIVFIIGKISVYIRKLGEAILKDQILENVKPFTKGKQYKGNTN